MLNADDLRARKTSNRKQQKTTVECFKASVLFAERKVKSYKRKWKGFISDIINSLPFEMHMPGHNCTGPGTKLNKRLNADMTPKAWSKPFNRVNKAAYHHNICYVKIKTQKHATKFVIRIC